ncbi:sensor histidine kinase [Pseudonocardia sp.]|uniref:sensor histidine kinase n=1 Tax=Pseudonocardia sp. TaxID=60912 RepID=UPI003D138C4B
MSARGERSRMGGSLRLAVAALVVAFAVLIGIEAVLVLDAGHGWPQLGFPLCAAVYLAAGAVAWWRRPSNRMGPLIVLGALAWTVAGLVNTSVAGLIVIGTIAATAPLAVVVHLLHAYPTGRLGGPSRVVVAAGWVVSLVLQAPQYLWTPEPPPHDLLALADRPDLAALGATVQSLGGAAVVVATAVILGGRLRRADPPQRRVLLPLYGYGIAAVLFIPLSGSLVAMPAETRVTLQLVVLAGVPVAFVAGILRGGFARTGEVEELAAWLGASGADRPALGEALARALGDDSLEVVFWVPERGTYVDAAGAPLALPGEGAHRAAVEVDLAGRRVGAIVYDAGVIGEHELVRSAGRVMALALDRERLTAALRAGEDALRRSRARIVEAGDRERRKIAQDLHDGLQVRLVLLALQAQQLAARDDAGPVRDAATALRAGIDDAAGELRGLVHEVMPAALVERGLAAATEDLVDRVPLPTQLDLGVGDGTLPAAVESTAYFVVAEGLANALKHAGARRLLVRVRHEGAVLRVEVGDDGVGGAGLHGGSGLRGLADRVDTLGGRIEVVSPEGAGTRLVVELPCGS